MSGISKICLVVAAVDLMTGFRRIAAGNYGGAVFDFILACWMLYDAWWYRDFDL